MHILHVVDYYHAKVGYQEPLLARTHARMGHRVTVVTSDRNFPYPNYDLVYRDLLGPRLIGPRVETSEGIRIIRLRAWLDAGGFVAMPGLPRILRKERPDMVIHHGLLHPNFLFTALASLRSGWVLVADSHMAHYNTNPDALVARWYLRVYRALLGRFVRRRVRAVAIGPCERSFLERILPGIRVKVIPLGADGERFQRVEARRLAVRQSLGFHPDDVVLLHSGKFQPEKKTLEVVRAFAAISREVPRLKLLLVGGGGDAYESLIRSACAGVPGILRLPMSPNDELPGLIMSADLGVWPGSPSISFIEAMAAGLPLVLERGEYGAFLLRANNGRQVSSQAELESTVLELARDRGLLSRMGQAGRGLFDLEFSEQRMAEQFIAVSTEEAS